MVHACGKCQQLRPSSSSGDDKMETFQQLGCHANHFRPSSSSGNDKMETFQQSWKRRSSNLASTRCASRNLSSSARSLDDTRQTQHPSCCPTSLLHLWMDSRRLTRCPRPLRDKLGVDRKARLQYASLVGKDVQYSMTTPQHSNGFGQILHAMAAPPTAAARSRSPCRLDAVFRL